MNAVWNLSLEILADKSQLHKNISIGPQIFRDSKFPRLEEVILVLYARAKQTAQNYLALGVGLIIGPRFWKNSRCEWIYHPISQISVIPEGLTAQGGYVSLRALIGES